MHRSIITSILLGLAAGAVAALMLTLMHGLEALIWRGEAGPLRIAVTIMAGGVLIAMMRWRLPGANFDSQLQDGREGLPQPLSKAATLAGLGIVSVGFGGAIGPEAGILAVVTELSALISARIARDVAEARLIGQIGVAGALGGLYGSPPGGAGFANDAPDAPWPLLVLAAVAGLAGLLLAGAVLPEGPGLQLPLPPAPRFDLPYLLPALVAGLAGAVIGAAYVGGLLGFHRLLGAVSGDVRVQVLLGTALFAALAAAFPFLRFNGQHELAQLAEQGGTIDAGYLAGVGLMKAIVLGLCLAAHWLGGPIMPLAMAGAAAGAAVAVAIPGIDIGVATAAGVAACCTVGMNKPLVVLLVLAFMATTLALIPMTIGVLIGWLVAQILPDERLH
ncbi:chloride channel protein [Paracoccus pacificus]|uniref:Chloride channel protein n=1 Tax=Paracoccus pacificus TaxID=1463598 RepID=A0ABW4RDI6_9RHOB